jgi:hypothetical protein
MPELNFKITGDDAPLKKTLDNIAKSAGATNAQISKEIAKGVDSETKAREKVVKVTQEQNKSSEEVVASVNEEAKAHDRATDAIKRKKSAFDLVTGLQIKPVQMSSTLDEVNASNQSKTGSISTGTVVGTAEAFNKASSQAAAFKASAVEANTAAADSANKATEAVKKTTEAVKGQILSEDTLRAKLAQQQSFKTASSDPAVIAEYTKKIAETQAEIAKLGNVGKRGYDELGNRIKSTIGLQEVLTTRLKYFQDQLQYAKAPQSFVALNQKIQETENQLNRLANAGKKGFDDLGNKIKEVDSTSAKLLNTLKGIGAAILAAFSIQMITSWLKEAREVAARGEGIREAFAKLDNGKTLEILRKATRGATSDIDLMAAALRAKNFQIAPELLAKGLELAGKVSRQTGQDVTYLTDSFVNGLGRKSLLILDNLQISQVQLRAEIKKTGDFQTAVGNVVEAKLKSMGDVSMTTADKMAQVATRIANIKELVGQKINFVLNYDALRDANKEFYETGISVKNLQNNIAPLLTKYDELTAKAEKNGGVTKLGKVEQALLKDTIKQVADEIPGAITQFDKYGNAMSISTTRAREFIEQQVLVLQALNEDRIKKTVDRLADLKEELRGLKAPMDEIAKTGTFTITTRVASENGSRTAQRKATEEEKKEVIKRYQEVSRTEAQQEALRAADSGELLKKRQKEIDKFQKIEKTDDGKAEEAAKKAAEKAQRARDRQDAADAAALSAQESLQQRIQVLKDKFERQGLTKEQEARRAIVDEFKKLAFDIEQQGKKYDAYAKKYGKDRATAVLGPKQTTDQIEPIRTAALDDLVYRQETAKLEMSLVQQRDLYEAFENWKRAFGEKSANKRFAEELDISTSYLQKLQESYSKLVFKSATVSFTGKQMAGGEQDRLAAGEKLIADSQKAIKTKRDQDFADAYQSALTHSQKLEKINADYRKKAIDLGPGITEAQKLQLIQQRDNAINAAKDEALTKTAIYKKLAEETVLLTREQVKDQLKALESLLTAGGLPADVTNNIQNQVNNLKVSLKIGTDQANLNELKARVENLKLELNSTDDNGISIISPEQTKRILKDLGEIQIAIRKLDKNGDGTISFGEKVAENFKYLTGSSSEVAAGLSKDLGALSGGFSDLSFALGGVDTDAGYLLDTVGQLVQAGSDAAGAFASFSSGDIIGGITKTLSAISSVLSIGKKVKEMNAAARKEVEDFYAAAIKGETDYQVLLRKRDLDSAARGKNSYNAIIAQLEALKKQSPEIQAAYDKIFNTLQGGSSKEGMGSKHGTWLRKAKTWDIMASLAGSDYDDLAEKDAQGKLVGTEKTNFDNLKALHEELEAAGLSAEDLKKQLGELLTGTSTSQLADGLKSLFENGKRSALDFGNSFEEIMKNALLNSFQAKYLEDALQPFYDELANMMQQGTPTAEQIEKLKQKYIQIGLESDAYLKNIEAITGKNLSTDSSSDTLKGRIESITATQADVLAGHFAGFRLTQLETNNILKSMGFTAIEILSFTRQHLDVAMKIESNTAGMLINTNRLETIEMALVSINKKMDNNSSYLIGTGR